jgi:hypothetical protein
MNRISFLLPKYTISSEIRWVRCYMSYLSTVPKLGLSPYFRSFESLALLSLISRLGGFLSEKRKVQTIEVEGSDHLLNIGKN